MTATTETLVFAASITPIGWIIIVVASIVALANILNPRDDDGDD